MLMSRFFRTSFTIYSQTRILSNYVRYTSKYFLSKESSKAISFPHSGCLQIIQTRNYAKGKDRKKSNKGNKQRKITVNEELLENVINYKSFQIQMKKAIEKLRDDYIQNVSQRSSSGSIESLTVTFDGEKFSLNDLGQVIRKNPQTIVINMINFPQAIPNVLKTLRDSGMNLNPQQEGTSLFIPIPKISKDHRESLAKNAKALYIRSRDHIKDIQNQFLKSVKTNKDLSEDESFDIQNQIKQISEQYLAEANTMFENKQNELIGKSI